MSDTESRPDAELLAQRDVEQLVYDNTTEFYDALAQIAQRRGVVITLTVAPIDAVESEQG